jgi:glycosyltransferase involved in cell wall biosynthesis
LPPTEVIRDVRVLRFGGDSDFVRTALAAGAFDDAPVICVFGVGHDVEEPGWAVLLPHGKAAVFMKVATEGDLTGRGFAPALFRGFDGVLCQNPAITAEARSVGVPESNLFAIRNGLNLQEWNIAQPSRRVARQMLGLSLESFVVAGIGRFVVRKRFPLLVHAFAQAARMHTDASLLLHGADFGQHDGEEHQIRTTCQSVGLRERTHFVGPDVDPSITLAASDVFVTLGEREGAPNVIIEAMASGLPVIATDIAGHAVYITTGVNGILVSANVDSVADAIQALMSERVRISMGQRALEAVRAFEIRETSNDYIAAFSSVLARRCV